MQFCISFLSELVQGILCSEFSIFYFRFVRTAHLMEDFCDGVEPAFFYGCLWECVLSSPSSRLAAINYVLAHFNRKQSLEDQLHLIGTNINILVMYELCTLMFVIHSY